MNEIRFAKNEDIGSLKVIWKRCFGDSDHFIDAYFQHRFKADHTIVLQHEDKIAAMLTIIPTQLLVSHSEMINSAMLYAIGTHPAFQKKGFASQIIIFANDYLKRKNFGISTLVPASSSLFDFYHRLGYHTSFSLHEIVISKDQITDFDHGKPCLIEPISPSEYNLLRGKVLTGRQYVAYANEEIAYQKRISVNSGAGIFQINVNETLGCAVLERITKDRVLIKEMLFPQEFFNKVFEQAIVTISQRYPSNEYIVRIPSFVETDRSFIRPFGMAKILKHSLDHSYGGEEKDKEELGYLGLAFD